LLDDHTRLARAVHQPALVRLHRALSRLSSVLTVMNTGAHPDDEANGLLAALRFAYGMRIVVACSTRGEGGQNALGPERGGALGVLRTAEMEEAARRIDADVAWLGHGPDDPVHDFGFSKDGDDTLRRWGEERIVERLVRAYRQYRPDIVIPTFLDVPGQHGHHRAMTRAAERAFMLAADPSAFPEHGALGLRPWHVSKFYLPAWSGAGYAYDDEVPPPPVTLRIETDGRDEVTGLAYRQLGEWSRAAHASQGMGLWRDDPSDRWELHLKLRASGSSEREKDIREHLPATLADLAELGVAADVAAALREAQEHIDTARSDFPDRRKISGSLIQAAGRIEDAKKGLDLHAFERFGHRLDRKLREIDAALFEAKADRVRAVFTGSSHPGAEVTLDVHMNEPGLVDATVKPRLQEGMDCSVVTEKAGHVQYAIRIPASAPHTGNYAEAFDSLGGNGPVGLRVSGRAGDRSITVDMDPEVPLAIGPAQSLTLEPAMAIIRSGEASTGIQVRAVGAGPTGWLAPEEWEVQPGEKGNWIVTPPPQAPTGISTLVPIIDGRPASRVEIVSYPHIRPAPFIAPTELKILTLDVALPANARIGYVGGGSDNVGAHMRRLGLNVTDLGEAELKTGSLSEFTTIVIGLFAFGLRRDLQAATERLHRFVEEGGHLVTLYHRPTDGWDPDHTPPRHLKIGSPSLRWRVTDPAAPVTVLKPDHPLLRYPNQIAAADWDGWDKERGLYFAADYDPAYEELIALNDPGENPLKGALLSAPIGRGRHTHVALVLHHQLDKLVPGAFRLLANLVQPASKEHVS